MREKRPLAFGGVFVLGSGFCLVFLFGFGVACVLFPSEVCLNCMALQEVVIPTKLQKMGIRAFCGCQQLTGGKIDLMVQAEHNAFLMCDNFENNHHGQSFPPKDQIRMPLTRSSGVLLTPSALRNHGRCLSTCPRWASPLQAKAQARKRSIPSHVLSCQLGVTAHAAGWRDQLN